MMPKQFSDGTWLNPPDDKVEKNPKNTKVMVLDGKEFFYYFSGHTVSGEMNKVKLATLGKSYKKGGEFKFNKKGLITKTTDTVESLASRSPMRRMSAGICTTRSMA